MEKILFKTLRFRLFEPRAGKAAALNEIFNEVKKAHEHYLSVINEFHVKSKSELHGLTYSYTSDCSVKSVAKLPTALLQTTRDKTIETYKSALRKNSRLSLIEPTIVLDRRTLTIVKRDGFLKYFAGITTNHGKKYVPLHAIRENRYPAKFLPQIISEGFVKAELVRKGDGFWLHIIIRKAVKLSKPGRKLAVYSIDVGERHLATSVSLRADSCITHSDIHFFTNARGYRFKRQQIRASLQRKGKLRKLKEIGQKEQRFARDLNHKISRQILGHVIWLQKQGYDVVVAIGSLKNIRSTVNKNHSRKIRQRLNAWPFFQLTQFIKYKLEWDGITVMEINESMTSKTCHRCGSENTERPAQGLFVCKECGLQYNADINGAVNIAVKCKKLLDRQTGMPKVCQAVFQKPGAVSEPALTVAEPRLAADASHFSGG